MLQGVTEKYLDRRTFRVDSGTTVLLRTAAGGGGITACQRLGNLGATVIGTVGVAEKADRAKTQGCNDTIVYGMDSVPERVREITGR